MTLIAHSRLRESELVTSLSSCMPNIRFSNVILPDLIFNDCSPSLSVSIVLVGELCAAREEILERLEQIQQQFKNSCAILIGEINDKDWLKFQLNIRGGLLRLYHVLSMEDAVVFIQNLYEIMKQKDRFEKQTQYLDLLQKDSVSHETSRTILRQCLYELEIGDYDANLIVQHFRSTARLIAISHNLPHIPSISKDAMDKIRYFFNADSPSLKDYYKSLNMPGKPISSLFKPMK